MDTPVRAPSIYDEMPVSQLLLRYLWPFWLLKDASRGDRHARAAAYRHNRSMRIHLPGYLLRWLFSSGVALTLASAFGARAHGNDLQANVLTLLAAGWGIVFACSLCVLFVVGYIYIYLSRCEA